MSPTTLPPSPLGDKSFILLPMELLLQTSRFVEQYELHFVKELFELSFNVLNRLSNPCAHRMGITYTLQSAIEQEIHDYIQDHPELNGYLSQEDQLTIDNIINEGYQYLVFLFERLGITIEDCNVVLLPDVWINCNLKIRVINV